MSSHSLKVCSIVRRGLNDCKNATLVDIDRRAGHLNAFRPIKERVAARLIRKDDGTYRVVVNFGWKRRSLIDMAACVLDTILPRFDFDFLDAGAGGYDAATLHLQGQIAGKGHNYVVTVTSRSAFGPQQRRRWSTCYPSQ